MAKRLQENIPHSVILNQYSNPDNPLAHELTTGPEIIDSIVADYSAHSATSRKSSGKVDVVVIGAGTGGTITGVSRAIKKVHNPDCQIIGLDPVSLSWITISAVIYLKCHTERKCIGTPRFAQQDH